MTETNWAPGACTLPTVDRPLREKEFNELFRDSLLDARLVDPTHAEFTLTPSAESSARELAARETSCCSFFAFDFAPTAGDLGMSISVPEQHAEVLSSLVESALLASTGSVK